MEALSSWAECVCACVYVCVGVMNSAQHSTLHTVLVPLESRVVTELKTTIILLQCPLYHSSDSWCILLCSYTRFVCLLGGGGGGVSARGSRPDPTIP